jgi:PAS domain-containing protein
MKTGEGRDERAEAAEPERVREIEPRAGQPMALVNPCLWAVDSDLRTLGASLGFTRLVGFGRLLLVGLPWYVILPTESRQTVEELIDATRAGTTATFELRHLDGRRIPVAGHRVHGGPGWHKVVLSINPLATSQSGRPMDDCQRPRSDEPTDTGRAGPGR